MSGKDLLTAPQVGPGFVFIGRDVLIPWTVPAPTEILRLHPQDFAPNLH